MFRKYLLMALGATALLAVTLAVAIVLRTPPVEGYDKFQNKALSVDEPLVVRRFFSDDKPQDRYAELFRYFAEGALRYASPSHERVNYRGFPNDRGFSISGLEGFARAGVLLAAWVNGGRSPIVALSPTKQMDIVAFLREGILAGTNPASPVYWGNIGDFDQRIVEAADIARILWMTRKSIWEKLDDWQRGQITAWIDQVNRSAPVNNNWVLFPVTVDVLMSSLGASMSDDGRAAWEHYKANYLESGWFFDWPHGVDYYNTWAITYELFWIDFADRSFDRDFIRKAIRDSSEITSHLISPKGIPIMGRSICYRCAVPVPLLAEALIEPKRKAQGLARHATDVVWRHFISNGALQDGNVTQGYFGDDPRFLDRYSGPGSCLWSLRSLVLLFLNRDNAAFWKAPSVPLPIETADFDLAFPHLGWEISGRRETQNIVIRIPKNGVRTYTPASYSFLRRWGEKVRRRPLRPENQRVKYEQGEYQVLAPFVTR